MKHTLNSKTLADARKEIYETLDRVPYKTVLGRRRTGDDAFELCYYVFDTKEDHEEWLAHAHEERQLTGPEILRHANRNRPMGQWFEDCDRHAIVKRLQDHYGCSAETARWVHKNLATVYDLKKIRLSE